MVKKKKIYKSTLERPSIMSDAFSKNLESQMGYCHKCKTRVIFDNDGKNWICSSCGTKTVM